MAGYGLNVNYSVASLLADIGQVVDKSKPGKSNYAIALDTYKHIEDFDLYIIGWTFSNRFEFNIDGHIVESSASRADISFGEIPSGEFLEKEYNTLQKRFFKYSSRLDSLSDYLVDATGLFLKDKNKVFLSWEQRRCKTNLIYPRFSKEYRQNDTPNWTQFGHLTESGMTLLANIIKEKLNEQK